MSEVQNHMGGFDPTLTNPVTNTLGSIWFAGPNGARTQSFETKTKVMPRLGFAWQASNNWVIRGGVGQYASLWSMDTVGGPLGFGTGVTGTTVSQSRRAAGSAAFGDRGCSAHHFRSRSCYLHHACKPSGKRVYTLYPL